MEQTTQSSTQMSTEPDTTWAFITSEPNVLNFPGKYINDYWQYLVHSKMFLWISPVLIIIGTLGNLITIVVLRHPLYHKSSTGFLLTCLAVVDTGMLNTGLLRHWIKMVTDEWVDIRALSVGSCKVHMFLTYYFKTLSPMTVTVMTFERVISVVWPLQVKEICSRRNIQITWSILAFLIAGANAHMFWTLIIYHETRKHGGEIYNTTRCSNTQETQHFYRGAWYWIDGTISNFIPLILIFCGNIVIIYKIVSARRNRESNMKVKGKEAGSTKGTTKMLLVVSTTFLLTTTPSFIFFLGNGSLKWWPKRSYEEIAMMLLGYAIVNILFYANSAVNFFLYCLSGTRFRQALTATICCADVSPRATSGGRTTTASKIGKSVTEVSKI